MKLEKAIEILGDYKMESAFEATPDFEDALKLGIEALKRISSGRNPERRYVCYLLPGETPPDDSP